MEQLPLEGYIPALVVHEALNVCRAGYYAWQQAHETQRNRELSPLVRGIFWKHRRRYGARRTAAELHAEDQSCGVNRVAKLLKIQGLEPIQTRSFRPGTTDSRHALGCRPNWRLSATSPCRVIQLWVADITYISLWKQGFASRRLFPSVNGKDLLRLHPELVSQLRQRLKGLKPDDKTFPLLGKKRLSVLI